VIFIFSAQILILERNLNDNINEINRSAGWSLLSLRILA